MQAEYAADAKARDQSVSNVLVADYLRAPNIEQVDISAYSGKVSEPIRTVATEYHAVRSVRV